MKYKTATLIVALIWFCSFVGIAQSPDQMKELYNSINTKWSNRDYPGILALINARLQTNPNDVLALSLKSYYYVFAEKDITLAHQAANSFASTVNAGTTNQEMKDHADIMKKRVTDISTSVTAEFTTSQREAIHSGMKRYPFIDETFIFWLKFTNQP
jgi:hypothetical protein